MGTGGLGGAGTGAGGASGGSAATGGGGAAGAANGGGGGAAAAMPDQLIFLGTQGGPQYTLTRGESSSVLVIGGQPYLVDCGYGTLRALVQANVNFLNIGHIFLTHLHDDHVTDLAALLGHQWTRGRQDPTTAYGPFGTDEIVSAALAFHAANIRIRMADEGRTVSPNDLMHGQVIEATAAAASVYSDDNVVVTSIENHHYPEESKANLPDRSLAYRFDSAMRSVVFSGDTTYSDRVVALAQGADILVCEAIDVVSTRVAFDMMVANGAYGDNPEGVWDHIVGTHTPLDDVGRMATDAGVSTVVINHLVPGALNPMQTDQMYIDQISPTFAGEIIVSADQMIL